MKKSQQTRLDILNKSFEMIYKNGFQATSIDDIIASTQVTKGAFFYHFKNKEEMGIALIQELMYPGMIQRLIIPLSQTHDPAKEIYKMMNEILNDSINFNVQYGCPMINLIDEMTPLSASFSQHLKKMVTEWLKALEDCVNRGKSNGLIKPEINATEVANYVASGYAGARNMGKMFGKPSYTTYLHQFKIYLDNLN